MCQSTKHYGMRKHGRRSNIDLLLRRTTHETEENQNALQSEVREVREECQEFLPLRGGRWAQEQEGLRSVRT